MILSWQESEGNHSRCGHRVGTSQLHKLVGAAFRVETALHEFWTSSEQAKEVRLGSFGGINQAREIMTTEARASIAALGSQHEGTTFSDLFTRARSASIQLVDEAVTTMLAFQQMGIRFGLVTNGAADIQR
ncbi:hypothetical protein BBL07_19515 [Agrobacterium vitis]|nr:hypothetical protein BBL07_19515 [Agrobacterium vitis]